MCAGTAESKYTHQRPFRLSTSVATRSALDGHKSAKPDVEKAESHAKRNQKVVEEREARALSEQRYPGMAETFWHQAQRSLDVGKSLERSGFAHGSLPYFVL
jgi:hypothetical protein